MLLLLTLASALAFGFYGYETLFKIPPRGEYERYGMPRVRVFVGLMQLVGAQGVLIGLAIPVVGVLASFGLFLMMLLALAVRYRIHDAPRLMVPALSLSIINGALFTLHVTDAFF